MRRYAKTFLLAMALFAAPSLAFAQEASHCDKISDDDAFNKCLAAASPSRAGARPATMPAPATEKTEADPAPRASRRGSRYVRGNYARGSYGPLRRAQASSARSRAYSNQWRVQRMKSGRVRMTIPMSGRRR